MSEFDYGRADPLPPNVVIAGTDADPERYVVEHGQREDGARGVSISDMRPEHDDDSVTQLAFHYVSRSGLFVHDMTGLHRHGEDGEPDAGHGECEHAPASAEPAPDEVRRLAADFADAPVASPDGDTEPADAGGDAQ